MYLADIRWRNRLGQIGAIGRKDIDVNGISEHMVADGGLTYRSGEIECIGRTSPVGPMRPMSRIAGAYNLLAPNTRESLFC